ncbi:biotin transport system permease protein [Mumia flava]|uniref:Biotin transport system permease protein n=1 Tax=Mumia flava TaxID=1348852 RepID=A0A0B2BF73_9ACTN|nr:energy-coupling factor transporter transmembrane component T [Mumia flava]PJJ57385.1 biotin transport system permease protein [Mumia flava]
MIGLYRPGDTLLHRMSVGATLLALALTAVVVTWVRGPVAAVTGLLVVTGVAVYAGLSLRECVRALRPILLVAAALAVFQAWQATWQRAVEVPVDLLTLVLAAAVVTATTPVDAMIEAIVRWLGPFRRLGVHPERVGLAFALMLRSIPALLELGHETRDAARARGLERNARAVLIPFVLRAVARAQDTGDALVARGIGDD